MRTRPTRHRSDPASASTRSRSRARTAEIGDVELRHAVHRARTAVERTVIDELLALHHEEVDNVLIGRQDIGVDVIETLGVRGDAFVTARALRHPRCDIAVARRIEREIGRKRRRTTPVQRALAGREDVGRRRLRALSRHARWDVRRAVAANPNAPARVLRNLSTDVVWSVRCAVASNTSTPADVLTLLFSNSGPVQLEVAANPSTPAAVIESFQSISNQWARGVALGNPNMPASRLVSLDMTGELPWVLFQAATNPSCPPDRVDEVLAWVTLGGAGPGDPQFDPFECRSNPIDASKPIDDFLMTQRHVGWNQNPLWASRLHTMNRSKNMNIDVLRNASRDSSALVRMRAAQFNSYAISTELMFDEDPRVRTIATRLRDGLIANMTPKQVREQVERTGLRRLLTRSGRRFTTGRGLLIGACVFVVMVVSAVAGQPDDATNEDVLQRAGFTSVEQLAAGLTSSAQLEEGVMVVRVAQFDDVHRVVTITPTHPPLQVVSITGVDPRQLPTLLATTAPAAFPSTSIGRCRITVRTADGVLHEYVLEG